MGMRSGTTFKKRQKEIARMEKQRDKFAKRQQRKTEKGPGMEDLGEPLSGPVNYFDDDPGAAPVEADEADGPRP